MTEAQLRRYAADQGFDADEIEDIVDEWADELVHQKLEEDL